MSMRIMAAVVAGGLAAIIGAGPAFAGSVIITPGQLAPITGNPSFTLFGVGEGVEWVPGEGTVWSAGVDLPERAQVTSLIVYCLDNVEPNAMVQLFKVKGDGSPPQEVEVVVTGGTRANPGTGYMANSVARTEPRVDRATYHYFVRATLPPRPDDIHGILRITGVEVKYEK